MGGNVARNPLRFSRVADFLVWPGFARVSQCCQVLVGPEFLVPLVGHFSVFDSLPLRHRLLNGEQFSVGISWFNWSTRLAVSAVATDVDH